MPDYYILKDEGGPCRGTCPWQARTRILHQNWGHLGSKVCVFSSISWGAKLAHFGHRWQNDAIALSYTVSSDSIRLSSAPWNSFWYCDELIMWENEQEPLHFQFDFRKLRHPMSGDGFSFILPSLPDFRHQRKINPWCDSPHHVNITALLWVCSTRCVREAVGRRLRLLSSLNGVDSVQTLWPCEGDRWRASMRAKEHFWRHPARLFGLHPARLIIRGPRMSTIRVMFYIF